MSREYYISYFFADGAERSRGDGPIGVAALQRLPAGAGIVTVSEAGYEQALDAQALGTLKQAVWAQVKAKREALIDAGAPTSFGVMDADLVSRVNISGAATAALAAIGAGQPFSIDWTNKANSVVTLDASEMIQMGLEVMSHVSACHDQARSLRADIDAAADAASVLTIDYTAGWPS